MERILPLIEHLKADQVCIVVRDIQKAMNRFRSLFGIGPFQFREVDLPDAILHGKQTPLKFKMALAQMGPNELELIEPGEGKSTYSEFLQARGEGVHHLRSVVSNIENEVARFKERGIQVLQSGDSPQVKFAYMDTEGIIGVILELLERKQKPA